MITVRLFKSGSDFVGFDVSGHSGYAECGSDIVCAAVSSAVGLCESAVNDFLGGKAEVKVKPENAEVFLMLESSDNASCVGVLSAFAAQMSAMREEYPDYIEVLEVQSNA